MIPKATLEKLNPNYVTGNSFINIFLIQREQAKRKTVLRPTNESRTCSAVNYVHADSNCHLVQTVQLLCEVSRIHYLSGKFIPPQLLSEQAGFIFKHIIHIRQEGSIQHPQHGINHIYMRRVYTKFTFPWGSGNGSLLGRFWLRKYLNFSSKTYQREPMKKVIKWNVNTHIPVAPRFFCLRGECITISQWRWVAPVSMR